MMLELIAVHLAHATLTGAPAPTIAPVQILVSVLQVAMGGAVVQVLLYLLRRRAETAKLDAEARKTDSETGSLAVEAADRIIVRLEADLAAARADIKALQNDLADRDRVIAALSDRVTRLNTDIAVARSRISELEHSEARTHRGTRD